MRVVDPRGSDPASTCPSVIEKNGIVRTPRITTAIKRKGIGCEPTTRAQLPHIPLEISPVEPVGGALRSRLRRMRIPNSESRAGSSVSAAKIAVSTANEAVTPNIATVWIPERKRPVRAIATVTPATNTARPAVPSAAGIDSSIVIPARSCSRWRLTIKTA